MQFNNSISISTLSPCPASTDLGIDNEAVSYVCATFLIIVFVSSLVGDPIILAASLQPNGIRLNEYIVTVMQHIAVSDLISCFTFVLPLAVNLYANRWLLGGTIEYVRLYLDVAVFGANTILISLLSACKCLLLKYPTQVHRWTVKRAHITCAFIWFVANIFPGLYAALAQMDRLKWVSIIASPFDYLAYFRIAITQVLPAMIMLLSTALILIYLIKARKIAKRGGGKTRLRGVATVVATVTVYCISTIPTTWSYIYGYVDRTADMLLLSWCSTFFTGLNIMSHFYIYCFTIPSFREFIRVKIFCRSPGVTPDDGSLTADVEINGTRRTWLAKTRTQLTRVLLVAKS